LPAEQARLELAWRRHRRLEHQAPAYL